MKNFIIITEPRSGSHFLQELLNNHGNIDCSTEIFNPQFKYEEFQKQILKGDFSQLEAHSGYRILGNRNSAYKGFIAHKYQLDPHLNLFKNIDFKIIFLHRKNLLKLSLSLKLAHMTNVWKMTSADVSSGIISRYIGDMSDIKMDIKSYIPPVISFTEKELLNYFNNYRTQRSIIKEYFRDTHESITIFYENLCTGPRAMEPIFNFLGTEYREVYAKEIIKQETRSLRKAISNYDSLKAVFMGTEWEEFFED